MDGRPIDLARARREAKALLRAARGGDDAALGRLRTSAPQLSDAQLVVARELGARSWPALMRRAQAEAAAREALESALVLGDAERVSAALDQDPGQPQRAIGTRRWPPLLYVTYSEYLGGERTEALLACARTLLGAGADPNVGWEDGGDERMSPLHGAAGVAHEPRMTALLLEAGADPDDGRSLRGAAGAEDPACLELLLDAGATLYRAMALAHATQGGRMRTAQLLLERGPRRWAERTNALVWAVHGEAPAEMLRLLVRHGAHLEASFDGSGRTPYGLAVRSGRRDLVEVLVALGAQRRVEPLDELVGACLAGDRVAAEGLADRHPKAARLLRASEADVLARAASRGQREAVEILLDLGVPVDARGPAGETALQAAGDADLAALLVARGADTRKRSADDQRHAAAEPPYAGPRMGASGGGRRADEPPYAELEWAAEAAYLRVLATSPRAATRPCGDGFAVVTGIDDNTENGVVCDSADDDAIAATLAWLADRRAPARWLLRDPVDPADLRDRLAADGASPERTAVVMGAQLDRLTADTPPPPALAIVSVREAATLAAWRDVARACLFDDADERARLHESLGLGEDAPVQHRVAMRDGRAIGAASFFLHGDTVLGQHLGVLARERRSGVGRALVASIAREARDAGARTIVLGPTPDAIAFFRLLGGVLRAALRDRAFYLPVPEA